MKHPFRLLLVAACLSMTGCDDDGGSFLEFLFDLLACPACFAPAALPPTPQPTPVPDCSTRQSKGQSQCGIQP